MSVSTLVQIVAACAGVLGSVFFAIGVMRQSIDAMASLSGTYFDWNPHMVPALAAQKSDYLFGGGLIALSFALQLSSYMVSESAIAVLPPYSGAVPWVAVPATAATFAVLWYLSRRLAAHFEREINKRLKKRSDAALRDVEEQKKAIANQQNSGT